MHSISVQIFNATPNPWRVVGIDSKYDPLQQKFRNTLGDVVMPAALGSVSLRYTGPVLPVGKHTSLLNCLIEAPGDDLWFGLQIDLSVTSPSGITTANSALLIGTPGSSDWSTAEPMDATEARVLLPQNAITISQERSDMMIALHASLSAHR